MVLAHADKSFRKLRKTLRRLSDRPSIEEVHDLRSQARRFEAVADTFELARNRRTARLLKTMKMIRKAAGTVRDMDVLSENALTLSRECDERECDKNSVLRLLHSFHSARIQKALELTNTVRKRRKTASSMLNQLSDDFKERLHGDQDRARAVGREREGAAVTDLLLELRLWPELSEENLHPFRLKVKHLRILMQLAGGSKSQISADLGKTKDLIGDWHDWRELYGIAKKILTAKHDRALLKRIRETAGKKMKLALTNAESLLNRYIRFNASQKAA